MIPSTGHQPNLWQMLDCWLLNHPNEFGPQDQLMSTFLLLLKSENIEKCYQNKGVKSLKFNQNKPVKFIVCSIYYLKIKINISKNNWLRFHVYRNHWQVTLDCSSTKFNKFMKNCFDHTQWFVISSSSFGIHITKGKETS